MVALSVDPVQDGQSLQAREKLTLRLVSDPSASVVKAFGLYDPGNEISWPAVYVLRGDGTVAWRAFYDSYKERPPVKDVLAAVDAANKD